jgi:VWFA-related protein
MAGARRLAFVGTVAALATLAAQEPQQPPTFRGRASLVRVDVTVTDRHGEPVTSLTESDFEVTEDGAPQTVETFKLISADGRQAEDDDTSLAIRSPEHAAAEAARDDVRVFLLFWDEYHIGRFTSAIRARKALSDFVASAFGPTDLVALMDPLLPTDAIRWTRNFTELAQAIKKLEGRSHVYVPTRSAAEDAQLERRDVERLRSEVTVSALKSAASYLGGLREGRKAIIFVSEGLPSLDRTDEVSLVEDLIRTANDNNTAIYTVDPRGLGPAVADELRTLASNTGAEAFVNTNTPARDLRRVITDASAFYLLGYASAKNPTDGKFHRINVRVRRKGFDVRARKGYWAPSLADTERAARAAAAAPAPEITAALAPLSQARPERALDLWVGAARTAGAAAEMTIAWTPHGRRGGPAADEASVRVVAQDAAGSRTYDAPWDARRLSFTAEPGDLVLHTLVRDAAGETIDEDTRTVTVPDLARGALVLGSPVVIRARNAAELKRAGADAVPFAGREFVRTDRVFVRFEVCGETAAKAAVSVRLLSRAGAELRALSAAPGARAGSYEIDLPLASIARGDYLIAIEAAEGDDRAEALVPFRVLF